jgi:TonB family protein
MILRAVLPQSEKFFRIKKGILSLFLVIALILHLGFFLVWDQLDFVRPYELAPINLDALEAPIEIVLELASLPEETHLATTGTVSPEIMGLSYNLPEEALPLPLEANNLNTTPPELPIPNNPPQISDPTVNNNLTDDLPYELEQKSFPLSRTSPIIDPLTPETFPTNIPRAGPENTINLEEQAPLTKSYDISIRTAVARHWILPPDAKTNFQPARFTASMTLDPMGQIVLIMVEGSSGNPVLDYAAMEALRGAAPYEPFPENLRHLDQMTFTIHFDYKAVKKRNLPER